MNPISYHPEARDEVDVAAFYYHYCNPAAARDFLLSVERIVREIQMAPQRWPFQGQLKVQRRQVKGFPYTVYYVNEPKSDCCFGRCPYQPPSGILAGPG